VRKLIVAVAVALVLGACTTPPEDALTVQADFTDVGDLAPMAPVTFADVRVGQVTDIELVDGKARVTMWIDRDADVPLGVIARVRRTSVLGEKIIDLVAPEHISRSAPALKDGAFIETTEVRSDFEDLVVEGSDVFGAIGAGEIATMIDEGARGFGGRGEDLKRLLSDLEKITRRYAAKTGTIRSLIDSLEGFNSTLAARSGEHRAAIANTARSIAVLEEESRRLATAVRSLARLSVGARSILEAHSDEMDRFFAQMRTILGVLAKHQADIAGLLRFAPFHNRNTQLVEYQDMNQVIQDFVICGLNDNPDDPARACKGGG
jgi:phospholipid/cholesterol/gamma-HCH transport system substrate-binding protein